MKSSMGCNNRAIHNQAEIYMFNMKHSLSESGSTVDLKCASNAGQPGKRNIQSAKHWVRFLVPEVSEPDKLKSFAIAKTIAGIASYTTEVY